MRTLQCTRRCFTSTRTVRSFVAPFPSLPRTESPSARPRSSCLEVRRISALHPRRTRSRARTHARRTRRLRSLVCRCTELASAHISRRAPDFRGFAHHAHHDDAYGAVDELKEAADTPREVARLATKSSSVAPEVKRAYRDLAVLNIFAMVVDGVSRRPAASKAALQWARDVLRLPPSAEGNQAETALVAGASTRDARARVDNESREGAPSRDDKDADASAAAGGREQRCKSGAGEDSVCIAHEAEEVPAVPSVAAADGALWPVRGLGERRTLGTLAAAWGWDFGFGLRGVGTSGIEGAAWGTDVAEPTHKGVAAQFFYANTCSNGNGVDAKRLIGQDPGWYDALVSEAKWQRREDSHFTHPERAASAKSVRSEAAELDAR